MTTDRTSQIWPEALKTLATFAALLQAWSAVAQPTLYETEPNNTPAEANPVAAPVTIMGAFEGQDQDAFVWTVSDVDAQKRWTIELEGLPGTVTSVQVFRLEFADNGTDVVAKKDLLKVNSNGIKTGRAEDLIFEPGEYTLGVARAGSGMGGYRVLLRQGTKLRLSTRAKPYDTQETAYKLEPRTEYAAFLDSTESWFRFELEEEDVAYKWQIRAQAPLGDKAEGTVRNEDGDTLARIRATNAGFMASEELELEPGTYYMVLPVNEGGAIRAIEVASTGPRGKPSATEDSGEGPRVPNSSWNTATRIDLATAVEGRFGKSQLLHFYSLGLDEARASETLALRLESEVPRKKTLCLLNQHGDKVQCRSGESAIELPDLVLPAGEWGLLTTATSGEPTGYTISLVSQGPFEPDSEAEPNDKAEQATTLAANQTIHGRFASREEEFFRLLVTGEPELWRFEADGDGVSHLRLHDGSGAQSQVVQKGRAERTVVLANVFLMPGRHYVSLKGEEGSYTLTAQPLGPPHPDSELEPNDDASRSEPLAFGQNRFGTLENTSDNDYYRFSVANHEHLRLTIQPPGGGQLQAWLRFGTTQIASHRVDGTQPSVLQGIFSPGDYQIRLGRASPPSAERYQIQLERLSRFSCSVDCEPVPTRKIDFGDADNPTAIVDPLPIEMRLEPATDAVAAYLRLGQRVQAELQVENTGATPLSVELETATSDHRWSVALASSTVELGSGDRESVSVDIEVPPDAWADHPVLISVRAHTSTGAQAETSAEIAVDGRSEPIGPTLAWPMPEPMVGGINAAWSELGGELVAVEEPSKPGHVPGVGRYMDQLIDGKVQPAAGPILEPDGKTDAIAITVNLAGDQPQEIVGVILNPVGRGHEKPLRYVDEFELQLSIDGSQYDSELRDRLKQLPHDQAFALEQPTPARFARLVILSAHDRGLLRGAGIGEWKVIARPETNLSGAQGWNLADLALGGHVVWARPVLGSSWDRAILTEKQEHSSHSLRPGQNLEWVVSFQHQRAARLARFEWVDSERVTPESRIDRVTIAVSVDSPVGPWTKIADWDRTKTPSRLVLESPTWARYVRFTHPGPDQNSRRYAPEILRIFEQPTDSTYSSILGEWGETSWLGPYELANGLGGEHDAESVSGNNSRPTAAPLSLDQPIGGRVMLGEEEDWYSLAVPAGANTLKIELTGTPTVRTVVRMLDADGAEMTLRPAGRGTGNQRFTAVVEPGKTYFLKVEEPPRAVVFAFDTSGSVTAFRNAIYRAVNAYAGDLVPGRDVANILPFGDAFLMSDWIGEPYILRMVLNDYDRAAASSEAEKSLDRSTRRLEPRPGSKAVVLVTDAATPRFAEMWQSLERVQPRVFTMRVGYADHTGLLEDLMQSWARVHDGYYDFLSTQGEMDRAFDRAATMLRRPAGYSLEVAASFERAPGPGKLQVVSGGEPLSGAVALILDASGSMLKRLEGQRRIDIAKDLLSNAVGEHIPAGTPVALRVFGHREPNSCRTDLVLPMKPLDPAAVQKTLAGITAMNLAKTPIADSLAKVEADLKGAQGTRVVILVTDGEETCDGDPQAVLEKLAERGIDLRLEIVGFAIADDELKAQFEGWAEQGGGRYFDAGDAESLERGLADALRVPYTVYDENGSEVARGTVDGDSLELEAGIYRVSIASSPPKTIESVEIPGESTVEVAAPR